MKEQEQEKEVTLVEKKASVEVKPVAWAGNTVLKHQAFVTVIRQNGDKKVMCGDPAQNEIQAIINLCEELKERQRDIIAALDVL